MTEHQRVEHTSRGGPSMLAITATLFAALSFPVAMIAARTVELSLKTANPDGVDVTQGLAYLRPVLVTGVVTLASLVLVTIVWIVVLWRREGPRAALLPAIVLVLSVLAGFVAAGLENAVTALVPAP